MSEVKKVCKCGDFKDQHRIGRFESVMIESPGGLPRCMKYRFSHHEEILTKDEFKREKNNPGFRLTKKTVREAPNENTQSRDV